MENPIRQNKWMIWGYPHEWTHPYNYHISSLSSWLPMKPTKGSGAKPLFCSWLLHNPEALSAMFPPFRRGPRQSGALSLSLSLAFSPCVKLCDLEHRYSIWPLYIRFQGCLGASHAAPRHICSLKAFTACCSAMEQWSPPRAAWWPYSWPVAPVSVAPTWIQACGILFLPKKE